MVDKLNDLEAAKVRRIVAEHLNKEFDEVTPDKRICQDLGGDSLDLVEIVTEVEDRFDRFFNLPEGEDFTVQDIMDELARVLAA